MNTSIIIPTLDRYDALRNLLTRLQVWPTQPAEILIIDQTAHVGGCPCANLADEFPGVRHIQADFLGPCRARNVGAAQAKGDILWFLDDDMHPDPANDILPFLLRHFAAYPDSVLVGPIQPDHAAEVRLSGRFDMLRHLSREWNMHNGEYRFSFCTPGGNVAIPRLVFERLGGFDERFDPNGAFEDRDFGLRCFFAGVMVFQAQAMHIEHRPAPSGGRRGYASQQANLYRFWGKYHDADLYYLQAFAHWLSASRHSALRKLVRRFCRVVLRVPEYPG